MLFNLHFRLLFVVLWMGNLSCMYGLAACAASPLRVQTSPIPDPVGVVVEEVPSGSAAEKAGLLAGDILLWYGGRPLNNPTGFLAAEQNVVDQPTVKVRVKRGEQVSEVNLSVTLAVGGSKLIIRPQLPPQLLSLFQAGLKKNEAKHWQAAITLFRAAFTQSEAMGETQISTWLYGLIVNNYYSLAMDYTSPHSQESRNANLKEALTWAQDLLKRIEKGEDREAEANVLLMISAIHFNLKKPLDARVWLERAYPLTLACHDEMWTADCFERQSLGFLTLTTPQYGGSSYAVNQQENLAKAKKLCVDAFDIRKRLAPDSVKLGDSYAYLAAFDSVEGNAKTACQHYSAACALYRNFAPASLNLMGCLSDLGDVMAALNDLKTARKDYEEARDLCRQKFSANWAMLATLSRSLARVVAMQGDTRTAQFYVQQTKALWQKLSSPPSFVSSERLDLLMTQGLIAAMQGDLESAHKYFDEALTLVDKLAFLPMDRAMILISLGEIESVQGDLTNAQKHRKSVLALWKYVPASDLQKAVVLNCQGMVSVSQGNLTNARKNFEEARSLWKKAASESPGMVVSLTSLAEIDLASGKFSDAQKLCEEALAIAGKSPGSLIEANSQAIMGNVFLRQQKPAKALPCFERAASILEDQRQAIVSLESRSLLVQQNANAFVGLMQTQLVLHQKAKAFAALERIHARSLADSITARRYDLVQQIPRKFREQQLALDDQRRIKEKELLQTKVNTDENKAVRKALDTLAVRQRRLDNDRALTLPHGATFEYPRPIDLKTAQHALPKGILALAYAVEDKQTYLFTLTRSTFHLYSLPLSREQLRQKVTAARAVLTSINSTPRKFTPVLKDLYKQILAPAQQEISRAHSLLICPDDALHTVPFSALMPKEGHFLIEDKPIHVAGSLTIYRSLKSDRRIADPKVLVIGDPIYHTEASPNATNTKSVTDPDRKSMTITLQALPETGNVAKEVGKLYAPHSLVLTKKQATIANLLVKSADVDILHLGCHGLADNQDPLSSWLALTPSAQDTNGRLFVWQIMRLKLHARLVVLWACETGMGAESRFEGIQGVSRAFLTAGADNVLMTLWSVQEKPTANILLDFYRIWKDRRGKETIPTALREAQLKALKRDPRPYLWASFVLNGAGQ